MRYRTLLLGASLALEVSLVSSVARADDPKPTLPAPEHVTVDVGAFRLRQPGDAAELGTLWSRVLSVAVATIRSLAVLERLAPREPMIPSAQAAAPARLTWARDVGATAPPRERTPARTIRPAALAVDMSVKSESRVTHAVLLGAEVALP